jgi:YD repeat-containing protein
LVTAEYDWRGLMTNLNLTVDGSFSNQQSWGYNDAGVMVGYWSSRLNTTVSYNYGSTPAAGRLQSMTQNGSTVSYAYDSRGRLQSATGPQYSQAYVYDGSGNLKQKTGTFTATFNVDPATNRSGATDAAGNAVRFAWDADSRMVVNGNKVFVYDSASQRVVEVLENPQDPALTTGVVTFRAGGVMLGR